MKKSENKNKILLFTDTAREISCSSNQIIFDWQAEGEDDHLHLVKKIKWSLDKSKKIEVATIYELCEHGKAYKIDELAENFLNDPKNGWLKAALFIVLIDNNTYFNYKKNLFTARTSDEINKIEEEIKRKNKKELLHQKEKVWADSLLELKIPEIAPSESDIWQKFLHRLEKFLIYFEKSQEKDYFKNLFKLDLTKQIETERKLLNILRLNGIILSWEDLIIKQLPVSFEYSKDEITEAKTIISQDITESIFNLETKDLSKLDTFTVDSSSTKDFDDAFSFESCGNNINLLIHITDVASFITKGSTLFQAAEQRATTLYTVKDNYCMFPTELAEGKFSLIAGQKRPVMSFEINFDNNFKIINTSIFRSIISVDKNLSFEEADLLINKKVGFWPEIQKICHHLKHERVENGALDIERVEVKLDISDPENIKLTTIEEQTQARIIIQELAILANVTAAKYCQSSKLSCLYRNQPPYVVNKFSDNNSKLKLEDINIQSAKINLKPDGHSGLGVDCYLQVTSPIRRFLDLAIQGIIFCHIKEGKSLYFEEDLLVFKSSFEGITKENQKATKKLSDHWKIKYLSQNMDKVYKAKLIRIFKNNKALVCLVNLQFYIELTIINLKEGDFFQLMVTEVNLDNDLVKFKNANLKNQPL